MCTHTGKSVSNIWNAFDRAAQKKRLPIEKLNIQKETKDKFSKTQFRAHSFQLTTVCPNPQCIFGPKFEPNICQENYSMKKNVLKSKPPTKQQFELLRCKVAIVCLQK